MGRKEGSSLPASTVCCCAFPWVGRLPDWDSKFCRCLSCRDLELFQMRLIWRRGKGWIQRQPQALPSGTPAELQGQKREWAARRWLCWLCAAALEPSRTPHGGRNGLAKDSIGPPFSLNPLRTVAFPQALQEAEPPPRHSRARSPGAAGAGGAALAALGARSGATVKRGAGTGSGLAGRGGGAAPGQHLSTARPHSSGESAAPPGRFWRGRASSASPRGPRPRRAPHRPGPFLPSAERRPAVPAAGLRRGLGLRLALVRPRRGFQGDLGRRLRRGAAAQPGPAAGWVSAQLPPERRGPQPRWEPYPAAITLALVRRPVLQPAARCPGRGVAGRPAVLPALQKQAGKGSAPASTPGFTPRDSRTLCHGLYLLGWFMARPLSPARMSEVTQNCSLLDVFVSSMLSCEVGPTLVGLFPVHSSPLTLYCSSNLGTKENQEHE